MPITTPNTPEKARTASQIRWQKVKAQREKQAIADRNARDIPQTSQSLDDTALKTRSKRKVLEAAYIESHQYVADLCAGVKKTQQDAWRLGLLYDKITREDEPLRAQNLVINLFGASAVSEKMIKNIAGLEAKSLTCTTQSETPDQLTILKTEPENAVVSDAQVIEKKENAS